MKKFYFFILGTIGLALLATTKPHNETQGYDRSLLDTSVSPCDDFYQYAVGGWMQQNPIPQTESRWGAFNILNKQNEEKLNAILKELLEKKELKPGSDEQLIRDFYASIINTEYREKVGVTPLKSAWKEIEKIKTHEELALQLAKWRKENKASGIFGVYVSIDAKNSQRQILHISQGGLSLPDQDYYLKDDERNATIRKEFVGHIEKMLRLSGHKNANKAAAEIMAFETELAKISMSRTERRDPDKTYNLSSYEQLLADYPTYPWSIYLTEYLSTAKSTLSFDQMQVLLPELIIGQPGFLKNAGEKWKSTDIKVLKNLIFWQYVSAHAGVLNKELEAENFRFYQTVLRGTEVMKPEQERALQMTNGYLGETFGKLFVAKHFSAESKAKVALMVEEIREVFRARILNLDWMSDSTKARAIIKLNAFNYKIGYPDKWNDYSKLTIRAYNLPANVTEIAILRHEKMVSKLNAPVDPSEWGMTPQTVNAYYSPSRNEIVFPAGILQPPFYDPNVEDALNYGGIGGVIGHEFSHGFDDKGSKFDAEGNLNSWWSLEDRKFFDERTGKIVAQFGRFQALPGQYINGSLTQGENIADLAGLTLSYYALQKHYGAGAPSKGKDGFTWQQRFFLGWALVWAQNITEKELKNRLITDPHSPGRYRVLGPLSNMPEFHEAWGCKEGDAMVAKPEEKVVIW